MLVLGRSVGKSIVINDGQIKLTVLGVQGNQVRIGIDAPKEIDVHREEVYLDLKNKDN